jgi:UDP-N-acetylmuramate dehydrogenase
MSTIKQLFESYRDIVKFDEPMSKHTYFGIGGPAKVFITPRDIEKLTEVYMLCKDNNLPVFTLGNGTNLLVKDEGIDGVVIKSELTGITFSGTNVEVESGYSLSQLIIKCVKEGLGGLEGLTGIPGTIGGAVAMNAGGKHGIISDFITSIISLNRFGEESLMVKSAVNFGYRTSSLKGKNVILSVNLKLKKDSPTALKKRFDGIMKEKSDSQPLADRSAGCFFKNPLEKHAGELIHKAGLKGYAIGGAKVSDKHANFIVNTGNATAKDVITLMTHVQRKVKDMFNLILEPEVEIW